MGNVVEITAVFGEGVGWHIHPMAYWDARDDANGATKANMMSILDGVIQRLKSHGVGLISVKHI